MWRQTARRFIRKYPFAPYVVAGTTLVGLATLFIRFQVPLSLFLVAAACIGATFLAGYASRMDPRWPRLHEYRRSQYREVWDQLASNGDNAALAAAGISDEITLQKTGSQVVNRIEAKVGPIKDLGVVEIACGVGRIGRELASSCKTWIGCDISSNMLDYARNRLKHLPNVAFKLLSNRGLAELSDASADLVYCTNALPHFDLMDRWLYVRDSYRVLRRGGYLYVDTVALDSHEGWLMLENNLGQRANGVSPPYMPLPSTPEEFSAFFKKAGFVEIQTHTEGSLLIVTGRKL